MSSNRFRDLYDRLLDVYGPQAWWPADGPFEVIVGAILTQRTAWRNVEQAMTRLAGSGLLALDAINEASVEVLAAAIRPAGFYHTKAKKLKEFASFVATEHGGALDALLCLPVEQLREALLGVSGIGEETADAIVVYAARKRSFVVDAYARRLLARLGWIEGGEPYSRLRNLFLDALPGDVTILGELHALIVRHGKAHCRVAPLCTECPLGRICATGASEDPEAAR